MTLPLARFTVLDLTRVRSGPTCVRQLADWGANVIKIEATDEVDTGKGLGGERDGPDFQHVHRNKRAALGERAIGWPVTGLIRSKYSEPLDSAYWPLMKCLRVGIAMVCLRRGMGACSNSYIL